MAEQGIQHIALGSCICFSSGLYLQPHLPPHETAPLVKVHGHQVKTNGQQEIGEEIVRILDDGTVKTQGQQRVVNEEW